jgi:hypothetical protein
MPANCRRLRRLTKPLASVSIITLSLLAWSDPARAYRPFDGTDAAATEFGVLLPDSTGNSGVGASLAGIVSQRWDWDRKHLILIADAPF